MLFEGLSAVAFGLILGSFANVVILRHGERGLGGRSACPHCDRTLEWYELFPVFSWIALRGRCRTCSGAISIQYPLVEVLMCALTIGVALAPIPLIERMLGMCAAFLLLCIAVYDFRHTIIPDPWVYLFAVVAFVYSCLSTGFGVWLLVSGPLLALPLAALWLYSKGTWMGLGDAKLLLGAGFLLGLLGGYIALMIAFILGALVGVLLIGITRFRKRGAALTMKSEVPFGPFLVLGICIVWFSALYDLPLREGMLDFLSLNSWS